MKVPRKVAVLSRGLKSRPSLLEEVFDGLPMFVLVPQVIFPAKSVQTIISPELPDRL